MSDEYLEAKFEEQKKKFKLDADWLLIIITSLLIASILGVLIYFNKRVPGLNTLMHNFSTIWQ